MQVSFTVNIQCPIQRMRYMYIMCIRFTKLLNEIYFSRPDNGVFRDILGILFLPLNEAVQMSTHNICFR